MQLHQKTMQDYAIKEKKSKYNNITIYLLRKR